MPEPRAFPFEAYQSQGAGKGPALFQFNVWAKDRAEAYRNASSIAQHKNGGGWVPVRAVKGGAVEMRGTTDA